MGKVNSKTVVENENLFRALVCSPIAILFVMLAVNSMMSPGLVAFKVLFVVMALCFALSALAYAAYYTNDCYAATADIEG